MKLLKILFRMLVLDPRLFERRGWMACLFAFVMAVIPAAAAFRLGLTVSIPVRGAWLAVVLVIAGRIAGPLSWKQLMPAVVVACAASTFLYDIEDFTIWRGIAAQAACLAAFLAGMRFAPRPTI